VGALLGGPGEEGE
jgi:hypothetical protein